MSFLSEHCSFSIESKNNPHLSSPLPFTVRQSSRELRQILHPHAAHADPSRPTGHRQHRPERICWILFHKPRVYPPIVASQRSMRRPMKKRLKLTTASMLFMNSPNLCRQLNTLYLNISELRGGWRSGFDG